MWSIAPLGNEIRYRVISRLLSRRPAPAASQPRPHAVETDKPPKTHRCSGRSGFTSSGVIPQRWPTGTLSRLGGNVPDAQRPELVGFLTSRADLLRDP